MNRDEAAAMLDEAEAPASNRQTFGTPVNVSEEYLNKAEQQILQQRAQNEKQYQDFMAQTDIGLNMIRLARLGLAAQLQKLAHEEENEDA